MYNEYTVPWRISLFKHLAHWRTRQGIQLHWEEHLLEKSTEVFNGVNPREWPNSHTTPASHKEGATTIKENLQALLDKFGILQHHHTSYWPYFMVTCQYHYHSTDHPIEQNHYPVMSAMQTTYFFEKDESPNLSLRYDMTVLSERTILTNDGFPSSFASSFFNSHNTCFAWSHRVTKATFTPPTNRSF